MRQAEGSAFDKLSGSLSFYAFPRWSVGTITHDYGLELRQKKADACAPANNMFSYLTRELPPSPNLYKD
jgi:hypothetical protein